VANNSFGWLGAFSAAGFVILGVLYLLDVLVTDLWPVSAGLTLTVAALAGIGAAALYAGNDPTNNTGTTASANR
jgi:hypothetical protein